MSASRAWRTFVGWVAQSAVRAARERWGALRAAQPTWLLLFACLAFPAHAHKPSDSYLTLRTQDNTVSIRWDIALRDLDYVLQLDRDGNGELTWGEVRQRGDDITRLSLIHISEPTRPY